MFNTNYMKFIKYLEILCVQMLCPPTSGPLCIYCGFWLYVSMGFPCMPVCVSWTFSLTHCLLCACLFCLSLICFYFIIILDAGLYSNENERNYKSVNLGGWGSGEDLGVLGEGEIVIRIHCMKKTILKNELSIFCKYLQI